MPAPLEKRSIGVPTGENVFVSCFICAITTRIVVPDPANSAAPLQEIEKVDALAGIAIADVVAGRVEKRSSAPAIRPRISS